MAEDQELDLAPNVEPVVEDLPPLTEEQVDKPGVMVGLVNTNPSGAFAGGTVLVSKNDGTDFDQLQSFRGEAVVGHVVGTLGGGVSGKFWDTLNTLRVQLDRDGGAFANEPEEEVASGRRNILLVGKEIIGFVNAVATGNPREWDLTKLCRGRRNTEEWIDQHAANEQVLMLTEPSVLQFCPLPLEDASDLTAPKELLFRATAAGLPATDSAFEKAVTFQAKTMQPFSPTVLPAVRDADGNATIRWQPRSKHRWRLLGFIKDDRLECCGCSQYEIDILAADRLSVKRKFIVLNRTSFIYTAANQVTDFGSTQATLQIEIYQAAQLIGRGRTNGGTA